MEVLIAVAKTSKYAAPESGDTLEVIERPQGGISIVLADGQSSRKVSMQVAHEVIGLLANGLRDDAAAQMVSTHLYAETKGRSACYLNIISVDLQSKRLLVTSNNPAPMFVSRHDAIDRLAYPSEPLGSAQVVHPVVTEMELEPGLVLVIYTDGLMHAGVRHGSPMDVETTLHGLLEENDPTPQEIADALLAQAIRLDHGRPADDMSIVALMVLPHPGNDVRRMNIRLPIG